MATALLGKTDGDDLKCTPAYPITHKKTMQCQAKANSKNNFH
jgi:hypothetical protein